MHALADRVRLRIFADLMVAEAPLGCTPYLRIDERNMSKSTISHHFRVLREAGLIRSERRGPGLLNVARWPDLKERFGPLIEALLHAYRVEMPLMQYAGHLVASERGTPSCTRETLPLAGS